MQVHGGDLDRAKARHGPGDWIDLSTGINPVPYPLPAVPPEVWAALPTRSRIAALEDAARAAYRTAAEAVPLAGASAAIQLLPHVAPPGPARVLAPTYAEHAAALRGGGREVAEVTDASALADAAVAVIVNPNNPDGASHDPAALAALAPGVGLLVVDESFADPEPARSLAPHLARLPNVLVQRSFGKFYGLAGLRLGFALCAPDLAGRIRAEAGPWPVSGPAIEIGRAALSDTEWQAAATDRLRADAARLDALAAGAGWPLVGGTPLFRTYAAPDAAAAQEALARHRIWSRIFPYSRTWLRLGLPGPEAHWTRLARAMAGIGA